MNNKKKTHYIKGNIHFKTYTDLSSETMQATKQNNVFKVLSEKGKRKTTKKISEPKILCLMKNISDMKTKPFFHANKIH